MFLQGLLSKRHWICLACSFGIVILTIYSGKHRTELVALLGHLLRQKSCPWMKKGSPLGAPPYDILLYGEAPPERGYF